MRDKVTGQYPQTTTFEEKGEPKQFRTEVPLLTDLTPYRYAKTDSRRKAEGLLLLCALRCPQSSILGAYAPLHFGQVNY